MAYVKLGYFERWLVDESLEADVVFGNTYFVADTASGGTYVVEKQLDSSFSMYSMASENIKYTGLTIYEAIRNIDYIESSTYLN